MSDLGLGLVLVPAARLVSRQLSFSGSSAGSDAPPHVKVDILSGGRGPQLAPLHRFVLS